MDLTINQFKEEFGQTFENIYAFDIKNSTPIQQYTALGNYLRFSYSDDWNKTNKKYLTAFVNLYVTIVRGTPLLLQLYFIFYGLPGMGIMIPSFPSAIIGLTLHNGAYISEIFRGAIESIDLGQREAARSLGMSKFQAMKRVVLPQAFKRSIPALGNQFIIAVKDSSLASVITITEIMLLAKQYASVTYDVFPIFFIAGIYYLVIIGIVTKLLRTVELKLKISER